jgi:hypothetical protein
MNFYLYVCCNREDYTQWQLQKDHLFSLLLEVPINAGIPGRVLGKALHEVTKLLG